MVAVTKRFERDKLRAAWLRFQMFSTRRDLKPWIVCEPSVSLRFSLALSFLSRVSILTRDIDIANLSVCLSVRNVPVSDENGLTYRHLFFTIR